MKKTHGEEKHRGGGPTSLDRKKYGRNLAEAMYQKKMSGKGRSRG